MTEKNWYESRAVWGGLIAMAAGIAGAFGYSFGVETQSLIVDSVIAVGGAVGGLVAVYGRVKADSKIK